MTVGTNYAPVSRAFDGATIAFPLNGLGFVDPTDLAISFITADSQKYLKLLGDDYTLSGDGSIGSATLNIALAKQGGYVSAYVERRTARKQDVQFVAGASAPAAAQERQQDRVVMALQEQDERIATLAAGAFLGDLDAAHLAAQRSEEARDAGLAAAAAALAAQGNAAGSATAAGLFAAAAAALGIGLYASTADALSKGVAGTASLVAGSAGTNGQFDVAFSGGGGSGAAARFTVAGGALVSIIVTAPGIGYTSAPTMSFAASTGLTGASATAVIAQNAAPGVSFLVQGSGNTFGTLYKNVAGVATAQSLSLPSLAATASLVGTPSTIGRALTTGGIVAADGGVWCDYQPTTGVFVVTSASVYIDDLGSGQGSFVFFSPNGSDWKLEKMIPATGISATGVHVQAVSPFNLPSGSIMGWYAPPGGARVDVKTSGGAGRNQVPMTPAEGASFSLIPEAFIVAVSMDGTSQTVDSRLAALEAAGVPTTPSEANVADRVTAATCTIAAFVSTIAGKIDRNGAVNLFSGTVTTTAAASGYIRYDTIYLDLSTLTVGSVSGTERTTDPEEFIPALGSSARRALFNLRVTNTAVAAVPVWNFDDGEPRVLAEAMRRDRLIYRRALRRTRGKIKRLAPLRIAVIGDSIVAMQSGTPSTTSPNGNTRDQPQILNNYLNNGQLGSDVIAALAGNPGTLFTAVDLGRAADTAGATHAKFGFPWFFVNDLQALGYSLGTSGVVNDNWGIAGTSSADLVSGASPSAWMQAAINSAPDLLIFNMGMNEYASATTEANMKTALNAARAAGIECLVMGVARKNATQSISGWDFTTRALRRAAEATGSAFIDLRPMYDDQYLGAVGITADDICGSNRNNHPAPVEHRLIGKLVTRMLIDD